MKKTLDVLRPSGLVVLLCLLAGCGSLDATSTVPPAQDQVDGLGSDEVKTLSSLEKVDDYPLYTMHYYGLYDQRLSSLRNIEVPSDLPRSAWGCSLFAALGDAEHMLYGRNFDWELSPAVLLFTDPADGYASVSMVDIAYLGFAGDDASNLVDLPPARRQALLDAPSLPFDGMNEHGLAIGMAAVPPGDVAPDPDKKTIGSLGVIREMLDHASTVDEAVTILQSYNIDMTGGPPLHYLIADVSGRASLVEFYQGEMVITPSRYSWHLATNFLLASVEGKTKGECWRYDSLEQRLAEAQGRLTPQDALAALDQVSQGITQWSVVYEMSTGDVQVVMGQQYDVPHTFHLDLAER
jgi:hypothetical protein